MRLETPHQLISSKGLLGDLLWSWDAAISKAEEAKEETRLWGMLQQVQVSTILLQLPDEFCNVGRRCNVGNVAVTHRCHPSSEAVLTSSVRESWESDFKCMY